MWGMHDGMGWWIFLVVGLPMMLGMGLMMWFMMRMMMGMGNHSGSSGTTNPEDDPLQTAKRRYARGEITREEFEQLKHDLA
jgi:putative membrane protein